MSKITINSCENTSNETALTCVSSFIYCNSERGYKRDRDITVNGDKYLVHEFCRHDELTSCNADFLVRKV